jgi:lysophospholipase L1-like esterase
MPFGENQDRAQIATEIDNFNQVVYEISVQNEVTFIDITPISRTIDSNPTFIASDGLHPSANQYAAWVKEIVPFLLIKAK